MSQAGQEEIVLLELGAAVLLLICEVIQLHRGRVMLQNLLLVMVSGARDLGIVAELAS